MLCTCKDTKYFLYLNTFAQLFLIIQKKSLKEGTIKRKKQHLENKVLDMMMGKERDCGQSCGKI